MQIPRQPIDTDAGRHLIRCQSSTRVGHAGAHPGRVVGFITRNGGTSVLIMAVHPTTREVTSAVSTARSPVRCQGRRSVLVGTVGTWFSLPGRAQSVLPVRTGGRDTEADGAS